MTISVVYFNQTSVHSSTLYSHIINAGSKPYRNYNVVDTEDDVVNTTGVSLIIFNIKQIYDIFEEKNSFNCYIKLCLDSFACSVYVCVYC